MMVAKVSWEWQIPVASSLLIYLCPLRPARPSGPTGPPAAHYGTTMTEYDRRSLPVTVSHGPSHHDGRRAVTGPDHDDLARNLNPGPPPAGAAMSLSLWQHWVRVTQAGKLIMSQY